jgi:CRP-like cAMP-binding protein
MSTLPARYDHYFGGERIPMPTDTLYLCLEGQVLLSIPYVRGDEGILGLVTAGMVFGEGLSPACIATALTAVRLQRLRPGEGGEQEGAALLVEGLLARLRSSQALIAVANQRRVEDRFRAFLLFLMEQVGRPTAQGVHLEVRLTHQQIASAIASTRVTVTRLMRRFREQELISDGQQQIVILDAERLKRPLEPSS